MNIRQLQVFKAVCDDLSFTKAAEKLYMTQPAVSHVISQLESELNFQLFDRISKKIYLTAPGVLFLQKATRVLELYNDLDSGYGGFETTAALKIGSSITIANTLLPAIAAAFQEACPGTPLQIEINSAANIHNRLTHNEIDLALIEGAIHGDLFDKTLLTNYELAVFCSPAHPFAAAPVISPQALAGERLLLRERGSAVRDAFDSALTLCHLSIEPVWTSVNSQALIHAVKSNLGISVLPVVLIETELAAGNVRKLTVMDLALSNNSYLVSYRDKYLTEPMRRFSKIALQISSQKIH